MKIETAGGYLDQMLRQTRAHHVQLSAMADAKANALMTMAAVITTFAASFVVRPGFQLAVIVLMCFNFLTILLATFAVIPGGQIRARKGTAPAALPAHSNILFFGTFVNLDYPRYLALMEEMMNDASKTYEAQVHEIYTLGCYLAAKKYRYLRYAYMCFLSGLFASGGALVATTLRS